MAMSSEEKAMAKDLGEPGFKALVIGDQVLFPPMKVGDKAFHFNHVQVAFLWAIQQCRGDIAEAAERVNQSYEWAQKFLASRKFKAFKLAKLAAMSVRNGDLVEWWWKYGLDGANGRVEWYEGVCHLCHETNLYDAAEAEMMRKDDMAFDAKCKVCLQPLELERKEEKVERSREQVQFWSELGNRLAPKVERVQHEFTNEHFSFVEGGAA